MSARTVRDLMQIRHAHVIQEDAPLQDVALQFIVSDCDLMVVTDAEGHLTGVISESSVVRALLANPADGMSVRSLVTHHAESVRQTTELSAVLPLFRSSAHTALPVVDDSGIVCGLLFRRDVLRTLLQHRVDGGTSATSDDPLAWSGSTRAVVIKAPPSSRNSVGGSVASPAGPSGNSSQIVAGQHACGPHFLRGEAAKRVLWAFEDRL